MKFSKRVDRGSMQMVQHHVIYSPEREKKIVMIKTPAITLI
jgi:hypothetical protein